VAYVRIGIMELPLDSTG